MTRCVNKAIYKPAAIFEKVSSEISIWICSKMAKESLLESLGCTIEIMERIWASGEMESDGVVLDQDYDQNQEENGDDEEEDQEEEEDDSDDDQISVYLT
ncbi:MAG: hypothetical protein EZS28_021388 [Streblomastix strix]|uniref:Uncharacterized protein n=1 Tax=Streblomastix strix TaxID=222440 RepID=A0A5J4VKW0_9EUKA|nr:MAG: hypothetical protein EZS28_021388 [Streblomastix strix]